MARKNIYIVFALLVALMVVGSLWDQQISQALYNPSSGIGGFMRAFGAIPRGLIVAAAGTLLVSAGGRLYVVGGAILIAASVAITAVGAISNSSISPALCVIVGVVTTAITVFAVAKLSGGTDRQLLGVALVIVAVVVVEVVLVTVLKVVWERPRPYLIENDPTIGFCPWWVVGGSGGTGDGYRSFPSAHTSGAATLMLMTALAPRKSSLLLWVGAVWAALVAASRIIVGEHFLSDTVAGFTVTFVAMLVIYQVAAVLWRRRLPVELEPPAGTR